MKPHIGIIGGLGTVAGLWVAKALVEAAQKHGARRDEDYPEFTLYNLPAGGMGATGFQEPNIVKYQLLKAIGKMNLLRCDMVIIACNTAHCYLELLEKHSRGTVLNMVRIACERVTVKAVGVLSSRSTRDMNLYAHALQRQGCRAILTTNAEQSLLDDAIEAVIEGRQKPSHREALVSIIDNLCARGAEAIILGCTELPVAFNGGTDNLSIPVIDAGAATAEYALCNTTSS
jgi:aspartate racemase